PKTLVSPSNVSKEEVKEKKLYDLAIAALKDNKLEIAEKKFGELIQIYPKSPLQSNSYFWYGETFFRRNIFDKAAVNYLKGYKQFPKGVKAADSLLKLALALGELKKKNELCGILTKLETEFPDRPASSIKRTKDTKIKFGCK
ncbi:MAG: tol-pal system protein YbgF, partial [Janthinobacterium lividum]